ncbi:MAG: hypothetical protein JWM41_369 [Gemmatimonadetes bacterium]|nr:hypothetical protein [Gemmatimonadota bacterium]
MSLSRLLHVVAAIAAVAVASPLVRAGLQAQSDVIRGRITGPDNKPVENATIKATSLQGNVNRSVKTSKDGRFQIVFPGDEGDYFVSVAAIGFLAKHFEVKRTADQDILVADAKLQINAVQLDAIKVNAQRQKVGRNESTPDVSGTERTTQNSALAADQLGNLAAMAASIPGVQLTPNGDGTNGFSVLGLAPDQNTTTLNGLSFSGANVPRDANLGSTLALNPYDVSRGGFAGAQFSLRTRPGSNISSRMGSFVFAAPQLQWTDPAGRALGQQYTSGSLGGSLAGPIVPDKAFYYVSYQLGRQSNDLQTLLNTGPLGLQAAGLSPDSVRRLLSLLGAANVPTAIDRSPRRKLSDQGTLLGSFDLNPPTSATGQAINVTYTGSWTKQTPSSMQPTELPSHATDRTSWNATLQGRYTNYYGFVLSETSLGIGGQRSYSSPYLDLPSGNVRLNSNGTTGVSTVAFGGSPLSTSIQSLSQNFMNQLSWASVDNKHRLKFTTELRHESFEQNLSLNTLGSFTYNSLADLAANRPTAFTRSLKPQEHTAGQVVGAASLGDTYRPSNDLQIQYGLRADANRFLTNPTLNSEVQRTYGLSNDDVPNRVYLSPRIGFAWTYGTSSQLAAFNGAVRGPRAVVRGGVGVFQNVSTVSSIGQALDNTGLPDALQQLACVGAATPTPAWGTYAGNPGAIPTQCADGTSGTVFSSTVPNVTLFDPHYGGARRTSGNLNWSGMVLDARYSLFIDGTFARTTHQAGAVDLNFAPNVRFALADEADRPVFAQPTSIVPQSGAVGARDARVSPTFNHVSVLRSDLASETRQLMVRVAPFTFNTSYTWNLSYVFADNREQFNGFASTSGNPFETGWGRSSFTSRHQITYGLGYNFFNTLQVSWNGRLESGLPYTPMVSGDVNGDGYANDRAFIFDPAHTTDSSLAANMRSLLANGSRSARDCLSRQLGRFAGRNSCVGPWMPSANLTFSLVNPAKLRLPQRAALTFQLSNPLGAADLLAHGEGHLHGWGQQGFPSSQLLAVRGFDPTTQRFRYDVNQRFGATALQQTTVRNPVTLTAMIRFDVGPTRERQTLSMMLDRGRRLGGQRTPEGTLKAMYGTGSMPNPLAQILGEADTLKLSSVQADSIAALNRWFALRLDSIWSPVVKYLAALPEVYSQDEAYDRFKRAREASVDLLLRIAPDVRSLLTSDQRRRLSPFIANYLDTRFLASIRSGTAGFGQGMMMLPGANMIPGGGSTEIRIVR